LNSFAAVKHPDDPERIESLHRFFDLLGQFIVQIRDDIVREQIEIALDSMRLINAD